MLAAGGAPAAGVQAAIVPHAAHAYSGPTAARGYARAGGAGRRRVLVLAPSHYATFRGAALMSMTGYRTPLGVLEIDAASVERLGRCALVRVNPAVFMREHSLEIQLPFLQVLAPGCLLVPLLVGTLEPGDAEELAAVLRPFLAETPETLVVVSSDLVHYGRRFDYLPFPASEPAEVAAGIRRLDDGALAPVVAADGEGFARYVAETGVTICGRGPIEVLLRALPAGTRGEEVGYATSLDVTGDHTHVVSYAAVTFGAGAV
jgi:AmmeMemoRadiSam system protein B